MARAARTTKTRSLSPRAVHPVVARPFIRAVEENRDNFFNDIRAVSERDIECLLDKLAPIFEVARSNQMLWQDLVETRAKPKRSYASRSRLLTPKEGPIVRGRQANDSAGYDKRSLIEYQMRRPEFNGPSRIDAIRADIDSILATGESIREREIKAELHERFGVELYPSFSPSLLKFFKGLQQTERYDFLARIDAISSHDASRHQAVAETLTEIASWVHNRSFRTCELVFNLERQLNSLSAKELAEMATRYCVSQMPAYPQHETWLTPTLLIAVGVAAVQSYLPNRLNNYIDHYDVDIIVHKLAAYAAAQRLHTPLNGRPDRDRMTSLYPHFL
jgi:hypothetical protein